MNTITIYKDVADKIYKAYRDRMDARFELDSHTVLTLPNLSVYLDYPTMTCKATFSHIDMCEDMLVLEGNHNTMELMVVE